MRRLCSLRPFAAAGLLLLLVTVVPAAPPKKDPPGTSLTMGQLRALFATWDLNGDGYLDKQELARAFRGPHARPYEPRAESNAKADHSKYPDYLFLVELDANNDGRISKDEFTTWARDYAVQLKHQNDALKKIQKLQTKLESTTKAGDQKQLQGEIKKEQEALKKLDKQTKGFEKALQQHMDKQAK
jgi:Ca2+-binding EF-hand superfamily protein